ncbi:MAG: TetR/AcrR family transcriptional regulator [Victivallales bacterium]|nr:TetR/AcrR family transcriptional regulator [Victivallales bacterium]
MRKTRELILETALRLFARRGFAGVSVRDIAGELELTASALYVHFRSKQELLEAILRRMEERDAEISRQNMVPQEPAVQNPASYDQVDLENLVPFTLDFFRHWTEDAFAVQFRHLLTIEQYRDRHFAELYQQYLGSGVIQYLEDIFRKNVSGDDAQDLAVSYFALFHFLLGQYDVQPTKKAKAALTRRLERHLRDFIARLKCGNYTVSLS